jgi:Na+/H+-dicarboxylate symporter
MTFSTKILVGLGTGVALGLFLGERAAALKWAADGFVKLLQMTVLPYVTVSIIGSLGALRAADARRLGLRAGAVVIALWIVALTFALLIPLTFPQVENAAFFSTTLVERRPPFNFVDLYIPANPFYSLANNVVPAVVLFSIILGAALIGLDRKPVLLEPLRVVSEALSRATRFIVGLTPYGIFAIAATAAGTLNLEQIGRLQVYLVAYVGITLLVSLWVLPGLVAALTPIRMRDMFSQTHNALITAFVAGDLFIVLPAIIEASRTLVARAEAGDAQAALPDVIVPASFNFPHSGKLLSLSFVLFAGWFADAVVPISEYPRLAVTGLITFFGSLNVAVPFLLDLFRIPADTFQLFLASGVINSRFGTLVAAMHTLTVALLGTCAMTGALRWQRARVVRYALITAGLTVAVIGGTHRVFSRTLEQPYTKDKVLTGMHLLRTPLKAVVHRSPSSPSLAAETGPLIDAINRRRTLRVGYLPESLPFAFFNEQGDLVGFDIELAHRLAGELRLGLEFVPVTREHLQDQLATGYCDLVMSGVAVTTLRASQILFSASYLDETVALVVRDGVRDQFTSWNQIRARPHLVLAMPDVPYYVDKIRERLPNADIRLVQEITALFDGRTGSDVDAFALPAERGSAWTLIYPQFSVVVPEPDVVKIPLAYPIARADHAFAGFINTWISLKREDGTLEVLYKYWILGQNAAPQRPRWSIIRNVLHWVD